jgi:hypothetical protein
LAGTLERASALDPVYLRAVLGRPGATGATPAADLAGGGIDVLLGHAEAHCAGARDYLAASVAHTVADAALVATLPALLLEQRVPRVDADELWVRLHETEPWLAGVWLTGGRFWALPDDPDGDHGDAELVGDRDALRSRFAEQLVALLRPVFGAIRARAPFGLVGMWGEVVDGMHSLALMLAHGAHGDAEEAWASASLLAGHVAALVPQARVRPRPFPVPTPGGPARLFSVRGTCCLWYKAQPGDPEAGYCTTCPLRTDDDRRQRLIRYVADQGAS